MPLHTAFSSSLGRTAFACLWLTNEERLLRTATLSACSERGCFSFFLLDLTRMSPSKTKMDKFLPLGCDSSGTLRYKTVWMSLLVKHKDKTKSRAPKGPCYISCLAVDVRCDRIIANRISYGLHCCSTLKVLLHILYTLSYLILSSRGVGFSGNNIVSKLMTLELRGQSFIKSMATE